MDNNADAKRILSTLSPERGDHKDAATSHHMAEHYLRSHNFTLPEALDMAQNLSLWKMWLTYSAIQS